MNKLIIWAIHCSLAAIAVPLLFTLGSTVTAKTLEIFELAYANPNNIIGSIAGALLLLALVGQLLTNASFVLPIYYDVGNLIAAGIFHHPAALARTRAISYTEALQQLKIFIYPKLKPIAAGVFVLLLFTVVFPLPLALLGTIYIASVFAEVMGERHLPSANAVIRGFRLRSGEELARKWLGKNVSNLIRWGASFIPKANEALHYILLGSTGTGKSLWREIMMRVVLPGNKAIVNDPKPSQTDGMVPLLEALSIKYFILNPFDYRCTAWFIGRDISNERLAWELALYLWPESKSEGEGRFFDEAGRIALTMIIVSLQNAKGGNWTLRLVILFTEKRYFVPLIQRYHPRPQQFDEFLKAKKMENERNDVLVTLQARLMQYTAIAALWERAPQKLSFKDFASDSFPKNTAIIIGSDPIHSELIAQTNGMMFTFLAKYLKALPPNRNRRIWVFIDEAASEKVAPWPGLESIMAIGRGAGIACCIAFHSISLLKRTFGELAALGLFELARHKAIFGVDNETAHFLSKAVGEYEYIERSSGSSVSSAPQGTTYSHSTNERLGTRPTYLPQEFLDMNRPTTGPEHGLLGDFIAPGEGIHRHHYTWEELQHMLPQRSQEVFAYERIDDKDPAATLAPLSKEELISWLPEALKAGAFNESSPSSAGSGKPRKQKSRHKTPRS